MRSMLSRREFLSVPAGREQVHLASLLLQIVPSALAAVRSKVAELPHAELHATGHPNKFAVVLESADERSLADATQSLLDVPGVLTAAIVAHFVESASSLDEELPR